MRSLVFALLALAACHSAYADPWDLRDFKRCDALKQRNIKNDLSGVTYSPVTGTVWTVSRVPRLFSEYSLPAGKLLREVPTNNLGLRDPEGIAWMYDYTFAIAQERSDDSGRESMITIVEIAPWREEATVIRKMVIPIDQKSNAGLEALTWDPVKKMLIAGQEQNPMKAWEIDPVTGKYVEILKEAERTRHYLWDFAGVYKRAGDPGLYVLSEPTEYVFHLDADGKEIEGQVMHIDNARMPEGLTFTPDGALMIAVGEPNDMWIYSSTGSCDSWTPKDAEDGVVGEIDEDDETVPIYTTPGFCSWNECTTGPQGVAWCSTTVDNCVSKCGGWWCSSVIGVPPITDDVWEAPPAPPAPPVPWYEDDALGYCNFNSCDGVESGEPWCRKGMGNCLGCKGTWCPKPSVEDDAEPITPDNAELMVIATAPWYEDDSLGYCNYNGCDGLEAGEPWCRKGMSNCHGCKGIWCPKPSVEGDPEPIEPAGEAPWYEDPVNGYCNFNGCNGVEGGEPWCRKGMGNCLGCKGTWCPQGSLAGEVDPILPASKDGQGASAIDKTAVEDVERDTEGYQSLVSLLLNGVSDPGMVDSVTQIAAATEVFGSEDAVVSVALLPSTEDDAPSRRLQEAAGQQSHVILVLNGETAHHAKMLSQRLEKAVRSGKLSADAQALMGDGASLGEITVEYSIIKPAGMSPQQFPVGPALVLGEVQEIVLQPQEEAASCLSNPAVLAAVVCGVCALVASIGLAVAFFFVRTDKKSSPAAGDDKPPAPRESFTDAWTEPSSKSALDMSLDYPAKYKRCKSNSNRPLLNVSGSFSSSPDIPHSHNMPDCELALPGSHSGSHADLLAFSGRDSAAKPSMLCKVVSDAIWEDTPNSSPLRVPAQRAASLPPSRAQSCAE